MQKNNYEQAKIIAPTRKERKAHRDQKVCHVCKRAFSSDDDNHYKIKDHCAGRYYTGRYLGAAHVVCSKKCKIPKEIPAVFHNGSTYDNCFIIKELAKEFKDKFECLGENTEKYITFTVRIEKEDDGKPIVYKITFIDSFRFISTSLSSLVDSLSDGIYNIK